MSAHESPDPNPPLSEDHDPREDIPTPPAYPVSYLEGLAQVRGVEKATDWIRCINCSHMIFYYPADKAYDEGHVYSDLGLREINITRMCEYCFDKITEEPE